MGGWIKKESLQKERVKLMEEWEEVKGELFVQNAIQVSEDAKKANSNSLEING